MRISRLQITSPTRRGLMKANIISIPNHVCKFRKQLAYLFKDTQKQGIIRFG